MVRSVSISGVMHERAWPRIASFWSKALFSACAVDPEHSSRLGHVQIDLICAANRVQHRTADSAHIGGYLKPFQRCPA